MDNTLDPVDSVDPVEHDKDVPGQKAQVTARTAREEVEATRTGLETATSGSTDSSLVLRKSLSHHGVTA